MWIASFPVSRACARNPVAPLPIPSPKINDWGAREEVRQEGSLLHRRKLVGRGREQWFPSCSQPGRQCCYAAATGGISMNILCVGENRSTKEHQEGEVKVSSTADG